MADNELTIILQLDDKASKEVAAALKSIDGETKKVESSSKKATDNMAGGFKQASKELHAFRSALTVATIGIVAMVNMTKVWSERNTETRAALDQITISSKNIAATFGSILAPSILGFAEAIKAFAGSITGIFDKVKEGYEAVFRAFTFATQFQVAFFTELASGVKVTDAWKDAVKIAGTASQEMGDTFRSSMQQNVTATDEALAKLKLVNDEINRSATLFKAGEISATEYYNSLFTAQDQQTFKNQLAIGQLNELASLTRQVTDTSILEAQRQTTEQVNLLNFYKQNFMQAHEGMAAFTVTVGQSIKTNLSSAMTSIITGASSAKEAFTQLGKAMIQTVVEFMVQKAVAFALEKTLLAGTVAAAIPAGAAVAAAWAPAALVANIASFGGAGAAAMASFATATGALTASMTALSAFGGGLSKGGGAGGKFAEGTDSVPAMLTPGEMVFPRTMADAIRSGDITVGGKGGTGGGDINVVIYNPQFKDEQSVRDLSEMVGFEIERELRRARATT